MFLYLSNEPIKNELMKKLILLLVLILGLSTGCKRFFSGSSKPPIFIIEEITQNSGESRLNVARYKVVKYTFMENGDVLYRTHEWFALEEGFQIGDTLRLTK